MSKMNERVGAGVLWVLSLPLRVLVGVVMAASVTMLSLVACVGGWRYLRDAWWWGERFTILEITRLRLLDKVARPEGEQP